MGSKRKVLVQTPTKYVGRLFTLLLNKPKKKNHQKQNNNKNNRPQALFSELLMAVEEAPNVCIVKNPTSGSGP